MSARCAECGQEPRTVVSGCATCWDATVGRREPREVVALGELLKSDPAPALPGGARRCQCEHLLHFDEPLVGGNHGYTDAPAATQTVKTVYGTFHVCTACAFEHVAGRTA